MLILVYSHQMLATIKNAFPDFPGDLVIKSPPVNAEDTQVQSLAWKDLLEKEMAPLSSILVWEIP